MYSVRNVDGKGLGCIANQKIKRGTLIEKEEPAIKVPPGQSWKSDFWEHN